MEKLPKEIINEIKYFYQLPEIDIIQEEDHTSNSYGVPQNFSLIIKYQLIMVSFTMLPKLKETNNSYIYDIKHNKQLDQFIDDLTNNKECEYNESTSCWEDSQTLIVKFENNTITIYTADTSASLMLENKNRFIEVLRKYRDILSSYAI